MASADHDHGTGQQSKRAQHHLVRRNASRSPREIQDAVLAALSRFRGGRAQEDDVTLVVLKA